MSGISDPSRRLFDARELRGEAGARPADDAEPTTDTSSESPLGQEEQLLKSLEILDESINKTDFSVNASARSKIGRNGPRCQEKNVRQALVGKF